MVAGKEYPLDILILSTGYDTPSIGSGSPAARTGIEIYGRNALSLNEKWQSHGAATLHGVCANGFPNLFFAPLSQFSQAVNNVLTLEIGTEHATHIIGAAEAKVRGADAIIEVTGEAEEAWSMEIVQHAAWFASVSGCTPGYITSEGEALRREADPMLMMKKARSGNQSNGMAAFIKVLEAYRAEESLKGIEVTPVKAA